MALRFEPAEDRLGWWHLDLDYPSDALVDLVRQFPGVAWDGGEKVNVVPADLVRPLAGALRKAGYDVEVAAAGGSGASDGVTWGDLRDVLGKDAAVRLRPYQVKAVRFLHDGLDQGYRGGVLAHATGTGKGLSAIAACSLYEGPYLVVCPGIMKSVWTGTQGQPGEIRKWLPDADLRICRGILGDGLHVLDRLTTESWVVINYEVLDDRSVAVKDEDEDEDEDGDGEPGGGASVKRRSGRKVKVESSWLGPLSAIPFSAVVLDEAQAFKNHRTKRYAAVRRLVDGLAERMAAPGPLRILLTATPLHNRPRDLWALLNLVAPEVEVLRWRKVLGVWFSEAREVYGFGTFHIFACRYAGAHQGEWGWVYDGSSNERELAERLGWYVHRVTKEEALPHLPPAVRQVVPVEPPRDVRADIRRALAEHAGLEGGAYLEAVSRCLRGHTRVKFPTVLGLVAQCPDKAVVFVHERASARALAEAFVKAFGGGGQKDEADGDTTPRPVFRIDGDVPREDRDAARDRFAGEPGAAVLVATMGVVGLGIDLSAASLAVFADSSYVPGDLLQLEGRLHRYGQRSSVTFYHVVLEGTVDEDIARVVVEKLDQQMALMGSGDGAGSMRDDFAGVVGLRPEDEDFQIAAIVARCRQVEALEA